MYHSILVPLDGSSWSEHAVPMAAAIAQQTKASLHLVHVHLPELNSTLGAVPVIDPSLDHELRTQAQTYLNGVAERLRTAGHSVQTALLFGQVAVALGEYARQHAVDLTVMTTHGRGALGRLLLGSVADQLVRSLSIPVLLLHLATTPPAAAPATPIRHILIPLDGSELASEVLPHALELGALNAARYTLLYVIERMPPSDRSELYSSAPDEVAMAATAQAARGYLEEVAAQMHEQAPEVQIAVEVGHPRDIIPAYAVEHTVDLIAMATHGRGGFARWYLGSVATSVMCACPVPLLLYRPTAPQATEDRPQHVDAQLV